MTYKSSFLKDNKSFNAEHYLDIILQKSKKYLCDELNQKQYQAFLQKIKFIYQLKSTKDIVEAFERTYYEFMKDKYKIPIHTNANWKI